MRIDCVNNNGLCKIDGDRIAVGTDGGLVIVNITKGEIEGRYNDIKILWVNCIIKMKNKLICSCGYNLLCEFDLKIKKMKFLEIRADDVKTLLKINETTFIAGRSFRDKINIWYSTN